MNKIDVQTDICIIGAGPAGLSASLTLSHQNIPHILLDAETFPRNKVCGEFYTSPVFRFLNEFDKDFIPSLIEKNLLNPIWKTNLYAPNGEKITAKYSPFDKIENKPSCGTISRFIFDNELLKRIQNKNYARLIQNCRIVSLKKTSDGIHLYSKNGDEIFAKLIIIATGSNNSLLKHLGIQVPDKDCYVGIRAYAENVDCEKHTTEFFFNKDTLPGGIYITPLTENKFTLNLITSLSNVKKRKLNLRKIFESNIENNPILKQKFANAKRLCNFEGSKMYLNVKKRRISGNNFMVIGDSAGLVDLSTGHGIPQAMKSGKYAAERGIEAIKANNFSKEFLSVYDKKVHEKIKKYIPFFSYIFFILKMKLNQKITLKLLDYLAKRPSTNELISELVYAKNKLKALLNPVFYYKFFIK